MRKFLISMSLIYVFAIANAQIVADHSIVDHYAEIPQQYIDSVKKMLVSIPGESHASGYRLGQNLLELIDNTYQVETYWDFDPPAATDQYLRFGMHRQAGEDFFFSQSRITELKGEISDQNATGNPFHVMGFGWCWDMTHDNDPGGTIDPVYQVRWAGRSIGSPEGNMRWGLDSDDQALTGNSVSMDTYLEGVESYILYCQENSYPTKWIFTTGPVDHDPHAGTENGFQREIKHDYIRDYVAADNSRILFDYADILCWNNQGVQYISDWNDAGSIRSHAQIHPENMMDYNSYWDLIPHTEDGDHIGEVGTVRLAKAMWWMLARMAGWDGNIPVRDILVSSFDGSTQVMTGSDLQFLATVSPVVATDTTVVWSVIKGTGTASISPTGMLKGGLPGLVEVVALANDGSGVADTMDLTIAEPLVPVSSITLAAAGGISEVDMGSTLQCLATVLPVNASNPELLWSVINSSGTSSISENGLLLALTPGMVDVIATAGDGTGMADTLEVTILDTMTYVSDIQITSDGGVSELGTGEEVQFSATVLPVNASNPLVTWSVINGSGSATISATGLLRGGLPGGVEVVGSASDGSGITGTMALTITGSVISVSDVEIVSPGGASEVISGEDLQLTATVLPVNATNPAVSWSIINGTGSAMISSEGLMTGGLPGGVEVTAISQDNPAVGDTLDLTITAPLVPVTSITVSPAGGITEIEGGESLQFSATVLPQDATNQQVLWSVLNGTGSASISAEGLLIGLTAGTVEAVATASDGSGVSNSLTITIRSSAILVTQISVASAGGQRAVDEGNTLQFTATVLPANATNPTVLWTVNPGTGSADISQIGVLTAVNEGDVLVTASAQDGSGISTNFALSINGPSGISDQGKTSPMVLYPNPSPGKFYLDAGSLSLLKVQVFSVVGSMVREWIPEPGARVIEIDLSDQHSGAFFIHALTREQSYVHRIIINR